MALAGRKLAAKTCSQAGEEKKKERQRRGGEKTLKFSLRKRLNRWRSLPVTLQVKWITRGAGNCWTLLLKSWASVTLSAGPNGHKTKLRAFAGLRFSFPLGSNFKLLLLLLFPRTILSFPVTLSSSLPLLTRSVCVRVCICGQLVFSFYDTIHWKSFTAEILSSDGGGDGDGGGGGGSNSDDHQATAAAAAISTSV